MTSCFISHSTVDRPFVEREIIGSVSAVGIHPWFSETDIASADDWQRCILRGLETSDWFIVVMSPASASSEWVRTEVAWAVRHRPGRIIPILIKDCNPEQIHIRLPNIEHIDFRTESHAERHRLTSLLVDIEYNPFRRASALVGAWRGTISQDPGRLYRDGCQFPIEAAFVVRRRVVEGTFDIDLPYEDSTLRSRFSVTGEFQYEQFVQLNYSARDLGAMQFGSVIAALSSSGKKLTGKFVGYGAQSEEIVTGSINAAKVTD